MACQLIRCCDRCRTTVELVSHPLPYSVLVQRVFRLRILMLWNAQFHVADPSRESLFFFFISPCVREFWEGQFREIKKNSNISITHSGKTWPVGVAQGD